VSSALALMLTLGGVLVPPDGCSVVAVAEDGSAVAACADGQTWFMFDPDPTHHGLWSLTHTEPPGLSSFPDLAAEGDPDLARGAGRVVIEPSHSLYAYPDMIEFSVYGLVNSNL
jgi:hypothetical protein